MALPAPVRPARVFQGWWVLLVAIVAMFAATLTGGSGVSVFVLPISAELGWDRKTVSGALSLGTILGALSAPIFGRLVDRYGSRVMLTATGLGLALTLVPVALVQHPVQFYLAYGSARMIDMGVLNTAATTAVANWFVRLRGRALGMTMAGNALGVALLTPLAQWIIAGWGWRQAWLLISLGAVLLLTPLAWLLVRRRPEDLGLRPDGDPSPTAPGVVRRDEPESLAGDWTLQAALHNSAYWLLVISGSLIAFATAGLSLHQVPLLVENGLDAATAAWLIGLYGLSWMTGSVGWGFIGERIPARFALSGTYLVAGACMLGATQIRSVGPAVVYVAVLGMMTGGKEALDALVWADYYGRRSVGAIRGFSRPFIVGATATGPFVAGVLYDALGSYHQAVLIFGSLAATGGLLVLLARPPRTVTMPQARGPVLIDG